MGLLDPRPVTKVFFDPHLWVERHILWHITEVTACFQRLFYDIVPSDLYLARRRQKKAGEDAHRGRLARTIGAEKAHDFAASGLEEIPSTTALPR